jgi:hypothetical protein
MLRTAVFLLMIGVAAAGTAAFLKDSPSGDDVENLKTFPAGDDAVHDSGDNEDAEYSDGDSGGGVAVPDCGSDLFCRQPANYPADRMAALIARNAAMVAQFIPAFPMALRYSMSICTMLVMSALDKKKHGREQTLCRH